MFTYKIGLYFQYRLNKMFEMANIPASDFNFTIGSTELCPVPRSVRFPWLSSGIRFLCFCLKINIFILLVSWLLVQ